MIVHTLDIRELLALYKLKLRSKTLSAGASLMGPGGDER